MGELIILSEQLNFDSIHAIIKDIYILERRILCLILLTI